MKFTIQTAAYSRHVDFTQDELYELETYLMMLDNTDYCREFYSDRKLMSVVKDALKDRVTTKIFPIGHNDDLRIDITYE